MARQARKLVLAMISSAQSSHIGSAYSIIDILAVLYFKVLRGQPADASDPSRDRFLLSKGHAAAALYAMLALRGYFPVERLHEYGQDGGHLPGHPVRNCVPGVELSSGSLGHGLAVALGTALALADQCLSAHVFVLLGDGECNEGSVWEAAMLAGRLRPANLTCIVDCNGLQGLGAVDEVSYLHPLDDKWRAFGWECVEVDGHDHAALYATLRNRHEGPRVVLARTVKGKGVSFMEGQLAWHYKSPNPDQATRAMLELDDR